ncbi:MAG: hypothetical protein KatS3mg101_0674 [Patescibacteria group bacterium]|nr:MAG: hypothetical protein KatS3mg101_0674 [Patescibacteria group bacterium]
MLKNPTKAHTHLLTLLTVFSSFSYRGGKLVCCSQQIFGWLRDSSSTRQKDQNDMMLNDKNSRAINEIDIENVVKG